MVTYPTHVKMAAETITILRSDFDFAFGFYLKNSTSKIGFTFGVKI